MSKTAVVALVSGGVDSVGMLYRLLTTTEHHVVAHHINFINREMRYSVERTVLDKIYEYLRQHVRSFDTNYSTLELPFMHAGWDIINAMFIGGIVVKNYTRQFSTVQLCIGDTQDDFGAYKWRSPIAQSVALLAALEDPREKIQKTPQIIQPVVDLKKIDVINMLPEELFDLTWSCRRPILDVDLTVAKTCGKCITCLDRQNIGKYKTKTVVLRAKN